MTFNKFQILFIFLFYSSCVFSLQIYRTGNSQNNFTQVTPLVCLAGGGNDSWAEGWKALMSSTHDGDVLIIRADGQRGDYESWLYDDTSHLGFPHVNSVSTLVIENKIAFIDLKSEQGYVFENKEFASYFKILFKILYTKI